MKNLRVKRFGQLSASMLAAGFLAFSAQAAQTVAFADQGSTTAITSKTVTASTPFTFDVVYKSGDNESGLGLKLRYDTTKFSAVNVVSGQTFMFCNIGGTTGTSGDTTDGIQKQTGTFGAYNGQLVSGWIYTAVEASGAVNWPDGITSPAPTAGCLVNAGSGTAVGANGVKLYRVTATPIAGFTGSTTMQLTADGNVSYAGASPGVADTTLTLNAGAGGGLTLAASNGIVSRKMHGAAGVFDITVDATQAIGSASITVEPRAIGTGHQIVYNFTTAPAAAGTATVTNAGGTSVGSASTAISGNSVIVTLTGVTDRQRVNVNVSNVGGAGVFSNTVPIAFLEGDVDSSKQVTGTDVNQVKASVATGGAVNTTTFRRDIDATGTITGTDVNRVKSKAATSPGPL